LALSRLLVDTSAYSAFMEGHRGVTEAIRRADDLCLSVVVLGELLAGFQRGSHQRLNEDGLRAFLDSPRARVLAVDDATAERYALVLETLRRQGTPISTNDVWIAASAAQHGLRVLTCDRDFLKVTHVRVDHHDRLGQAGSAE
jgi:predicted nucleic acid-binding protein